MSFYQDKRILFIAPKFYHYHQEIVNSLENRGANVRFYPEMIHSILFRISNKISKNLETYLRDIYINSILVDIEKDAFDIVFVIRGGYFSDDSLESLHTKLPNAKFYMYQWDSTRQNNYLPIVKYFDRVQTFDMVDAKKYNLDYLPLFYTNKYKKLQNEKKKTLYDIVFFGAYHSDRLYVVKEIDRLSKEYGLVFKHHLYITKLALFRLLVTGNISLKDIKYFKTFFVSLDEIIDVYKVTDAVLDVELGIQNGFTIRTIEALGSNLKLLTTNKNIKEADFYNPETIMWIDRSHIELDKNFFHKTYQKNNALDKYYIDNWLDSILIES